jgi:glycosyltransferase involved in cell wall biosynthesis
MKVALVHDTLNQPGGAEKVLEEFHALYPEAPVFCSVYRPEAMPPQYASWDIRPSWLARLPGASRHHRALLPLYPSAMHALDLSGYDMILSSSFNFAHNVVPDQVARHVCYCHSPGRFLWDYHGYARREGFSPAKRAAALPFLPWLRTQDVASAQRVDRWIATSRTVQQRIQKIYRRRSTIIPPPVDLSEFDMTRGAHGNYLLLMMRLVGWKCADIVIEACNALRLPLIIAGDGRDRSRLERLAGPTVSFVGRVDGSAKAELYRNCAAFVLPAVEDFGIAPLEAMASGRPVIALGEGGALDTVVPGITGEFFPEQTATSLAELLRHFDPDAYDPAVIRRHAENFSSDRFRQRIHAFVLASYRRQGFAVARPAARSADAMVPAAAEFAAAADPAPVASAL